MSFRVVCDTCDTVTLDDTLALSVPEHMLDTPDVPEDGYHILHFCTWRCLGKAVASLIAPAKAALANNNTPANARDAADHAPTQPELDLDLDETPQAPPAPPVDASQFMSAFGITRK